MEIFLHKYFFAEDNLFLRETNYFYYHLKIAGLSAVFVTIFFGYYFLQLLDLY